LVVVARIESRQLGAGSVQDDDTQRAHLGIGAQLNKTHS